jgi:hypothetical protein
MYAIWRVTRQTAIIATAIDTHPFVYGPRALFKGTVNGQAFWLPNMNCLERWALAAGFKRVERVSTFRLVSRDDKFSTPHGTIKTYIE